MNVIYLRIESEYKRKLELDAKKLGLSLTAYCRMILLESLKEEEKHENN
jgi:predicted HicB family RNase H-like nuclease